MLGPWLPSWAAMVVAGLGGGWWEMQGWNGRGSESETLKLIMVLTGILTNIYLLYNCEAPDKHYFNTVLLQEMRFSLGDLSRHTHLVSRSIVIVNTRPSDYRTIFLVSVWGEEVSSNLLRWLESFWLHKAWLNVLCLILELIESSSQIVHWP